MCLGLVPHLQAGPLDALRAGAALKCEPALRFYCRNVHVSCAGQSEIRTRPLTVRAGSHGRQFRLRVGSARAVDAGTALAVAGLFDADGQALTLRPDQRSGYVRIVAAGRYAERTHQFGPALMAYGQCSVITTD